MTTTRKMLAAVAVAAIALFGTVGIAMANPQHVDDGGTHGGHTHSHADHYGFGDDNGCNFKYRRDGSRNRHFDGDNSDCPKQNPMENPPNPGVSGGSGNGADLIPGL